MAGHDAPISRCLFAANLSSLSEIKDDDFNNLSNAAQLADYVHHIRKASKETCFYHVSRYSPTLHDRLMLETAHSSGLPVLNLRYRRIYDKLLSAKSKDAKKSVFVKMVLDYLDDIGVTRYQVIDLTRRAKDVSFFLAQAVGFPHSHGLGKLNSRQTLKAIPDIFGQILDNLEAIAELVRDQNQSIFSQRFTRAYRPYPYFDLKALRKAMPADADDEDPLNLYQSAFTLTLRPVLLVVVGEGPPSTSLLVARAERRGCRPSSA